MHRTLATVVTVAAALLALAISAGDALAQSKPCAECHHDDATDAGAVPPDAR